jgi:predicted AAA+ superfamily ATPase
MEALVDKYRRLFSAVDTTFTRGLYNSINWNARAISIQGARGTGKSTLMLQHIRMASLPVDKTLYVSLDDLFFQDTSITEVATTFVKFGGKHLFLDEVHKYPNWQQSVKNIYDFNPELQLIISGSSILALQQALPDLGRRVLNYHLHELSLREFIALKYGINLPVISWEDLVNRHPQLSQDIISSVSIPLAKVDEYNRFGSYPFFMEGESDYPQRLNQLINLIIDYDLPDVIPVEVSTRTQLKQLLYIVSRSVPFTPNISKLALQLTVSRSRLLELLQILERAQLVRSLRSETMGVSLLNKPQKLYLRNPNLIYLLGEGRPDIGNLRETWVLGHLDGSGHSLRYPKTGDVLVDDMWTVEIGGAKKSDRQVKSTPNSLIIRDSLEHGYGNVIPMWMLGFLY